jgi:hypothetical protein
MINRELTAREKQIYEAIPDQDSMTFENIVDVVRRDVSISMYRQKKELKRMHNQ